MPEWGGNSLQSGDGIEKLSLNLHKSLEQYGGLSLVTHEVREESPGNTEHHIS